MTERMIAAPQTTVSQRRTQSLNRAWFGVVFAVAVLTGLGTAWFMRGSAPPTGAAPAPAPKPAVKPAPLPTPEVEVAVAEPAHVEQHPTEPEPAAVVEPAPKTPSPVRPKQPRKTSPVVAAAVQPTPAPTHVEEPAPVQIPQGEGTLRVNSTGTTEGVTVFLNGQAKGPPPVNFPKLSSGVYTVEIKLSNGKKSRAWKGPVMPDVTTALFFDADSGSWTKR